MGEAWTAGAAHGSALTYPPSLFPALLLAAGSGGTRQELAGVKKRQGKRFLTQVGFRVVVLVFSGKLTCGSGFFPPPPRCFWQ